MNALTEQVLPLVISLNTVLSMWLAGSRNTMAWVLGLAGQALWAIFAVMFEAWGLLPLVVVLTFVYARNLVRWKRENTVTTSGNTKVRTPMQGSNGT